MPVIKFPSEWLKANDNVMAGDNIQFMDTGEFDEEKNNWTFTVAIVRDGMPGEIKKFSLNKTNYEAVKKVYGDNSDNWLHKEMTVTVYKARNPIKNCLVDAIALEAPKPVAAPAA